MRITPAGDFSPNDRRLLMQESPARYSQQAALSLFPKESQAFALSAFYILFNDIHHEPPSRK